MTKMLASVNSVTEALMVLQENVDIIDLKQPAHGALGALDHDVINAIVTAIGHRKPVSATIGDLPMQAEIIFNAVHAMANTGVDYIKIGFFPSTTWPAVIDKLAELTPTHALIAVLFADGQPDLTVITQLKQAGFSGVMLDTMDKKQGSLTQIMPNDTLQRFVDMAKDHHLLCGLAGSLTWQDIPGLLMLESDYLGFRGALCDHRNRTGQLNLQSIKHIRQSLTPPS